MNKVASESIYIFLWTKHYLMIHYSNIASPGLSSSLTTIQSEAWYRLAAGASGIDYTDHNLW